MFALQRILFGFLLKSCQLLLRCLQRVDIKIDRDAFKSDRHRFRHAEYPLQIQVSLNCHLSEALAGVARLQG